MTIFVYKGLTRKPEIGNTRVWVLPKIWRLRGARDVSNRKLLNARVTTFTVSESGQEFLYSRYFTESAELRISRTFVPYEA